MKLLHQGHLHPGSSFPGLSLLQSIDQSIAAIGQRDCQTQSPTLLLQFSPALLILQRYLTLTLPSPPRPAALHSVPLLPKPPVAKVAAAAFRSPTRRWCPRSSRSMDRSPPGTSVPDGANVPCARARSRDRWLRNHWWWNTWKEDRTKREHGTSVADG